MRRKAATSISLAALTAVLGNVSLAQQPAAKAPSKPMARAMEPGAVSALDRMGAFLRTLNAFQVTSQTTRDEILPDGQRVTFAGTADLLVRRPDRLRAEVTSDLQHRQYFYDGKNFTLYAKRVNYFATVPAPPTLHELADALADKYDIEVPLADLFYWGTPRANSAMFWSALDIGPGQVDGTSCEHYAFRQDGLDWQIWIQLGDYPLPRKLVLTTTDDPARPQYASVLAWNLAPSYNDATFAFDAPSDAKRITFAELPAGGKGK